MPDEQVCKYNQTGFCKFRDSCRKRHEQKKSGLLKYQMFIPKYIKVMNQKEPAGLKMTAHTNIKRTRQMQ